MPNPQDYTLLQWSHPDPDYIKIREKLIPEAEKWTNKLCGKKYRGKNKKERDVWNARWSREFLKRVDFLYQEKIEELCQGKDTGSSTWTKSVEIADTLTP